MDDATRIEIFRPGTFTSLEGTVVTFGDADLRAIAAAYDGEANPAPLVIGHPALEDPAWGWVDRLELDGDRLVAIPRDVEPAFAELVRDKRYARVSARFYPKGAANSPAPGAAYLKHVGFLGAAAPAVKGLRPISFAADDLAGTLTVDLPEPPKEPAVAEAETQSFAELSGEVASLKAQLAERGRADAAAATVARHDAAVSFADTQISAGRLAPVGKALVVGLLESLDAATAISFGEGDANKLTPAAAFRKLFETAQPVVSFGEIAGRGTAPGSARAEDESAVLAREAISFADAEVAAGRARPSVTDAVGHVKRTRAAAAA